jgi:hypothetical protein
MLMQARFNGCAVTRALAVAMALMLITGCAHLHWPWHHAPPPPPAPVHELDMSGAGVAGFPQYWKRNTLLVDLRGASASGSAVMKPIAGTTWPVRLGFRVTPGAFGTLEVRGEQRVLLPISASGAQPIELELPPGVYTAKTPEITVSWGPGGVASP